MTALMRPSSQPGLLAIVLATLLMATSTNTDSIMMKLHCLGSGTSKLTIGCDYPTAIHVTQAHYGVRRSDTTMDCDQLAIQDTDCMSWPTALTESFRDVCNSYSTCTEIVGPASDIMFDCDQSYNGGQTYIHVEYQCIPVTTTDGIIYPMVTENNSIWHEALQVHLRSEFYPTFAELILSEIMCEVSVPASTTLLVQVLQLSHNPMREQDNFCLHMNTQYRYCSMIGGTYEARRVQPYSKQSVFFRFSSTMQGRMPTGRYWVVLKAEGPASNLTLRARCGEIVRQQWDTLTFLTTTTRDVDYTITPTLHSQDNSVVLNVSTVSPQVEALEPQAIDVGLVVGCAMSGLVMVLLLVVFITAICWKRRASDKAASSSTGTLESVTTFQQVNGLYTISELTEPEGVQSTPEPEPVEKTNVYVVSPGGQGQESKGILKEQSVNRTEAVSTDGHDYEEVAGSNQEQASSSAGLPDVLKTGKFVTWADPDSIRSKEKPKETPAYKGSKAIHQAALRDKLGKVFSKRQGKQTSSGQEKTNKNNPKGNEQSPPPLPVKKERHARKYESLRNDDDSNNSDEVKNVSKAGETKSDNRSAPPTKVIPQSDGFTTWAGPASANSRNTPKETPAHKGSKAVHKAAMAAKLGKMRNKEKQEQTKNEQEKSEHTSHKDSVQSAQDKTTGDTNSCNPPASPSNDNFNNRRSDYAELGSELDDYEIVECGGYASLDGHTSKNQNMASETEQSEETLEYDDSDYAKVLKDEEEPVGSDAEATLYAAQPKKPHSQLPEKTLSDSTLSLDKRPPTLPRRVWHDETEPDSVPDPTSQQTVPNPKRASSISTGHTHSLPPSAARTTMSCKDLSQGATPPTSSMLSAEGLEPMLESDSAPGPAIAASSPQLSSCSPAAMDSDTISLGSVNSQQSLQASQIIRTIDRMYNMAIAGNDTEAEANPRGVHVYNMLL